MLRSMFRFVIVCSAIALQIVTPGRLRADTVKTIPLAAHSLLWDGHSRRLYATVPGAGPNTAGRANTLTIINPESGEIVSSTFVGAEPGGMALSTSGRYLFIAISGANSVRVYDLVKQAVGPMIPLGNSITVAGMCAVPGFPDSVAVQRQNRLYSPSENGTVILNADGSIRKNPINSGHSLVYDALTDRMYGFENEISSFGMRTMSADADGVVELGYTEGVLNGNIALSAARNGLIYSNTGAVIDAASITKVGQYPGFGYGSNVVPDPETSKVFFGIGGRRGVTIEAFDMFQFSSLGSISVDAGGDLAGQLIRWGANGFAFQNSKSGICLVQTDLVGGPKPACDLSVTTSGLPKNIAAGGSAICTVTVLNRGANAATGVVVSDLLSRNLDVINVSSTAGAATAANGIARVEFERLEPRASQKLTVEVRLKQVDAGREQSASVSQTAFVRAHEMDLNPVNNHDTQTARIGAGDPVQPLAVVGPDLTGSWKALSQLSEGAGADLQATVLGDFDVKNLGTDVAGPSRIRFFLSESRDYRPELSQLLQEIGVPSIKAGGVYSIKLKARLPKGVDVIGLYVVAVVNATNTVVETNKKNNAVVSEPVP